MVKAYFHPLGAEISKDKQGHVVEEVLDIVLSKFGNGKYPKERMEDLLKVKGKDYDKLRGGIMETLNILSEAANVLSELESIKSESDKPSLDSSSNDERVKELEDKLENLKAKAMNKLVNTLNEVTDFRWDDIDISVIDEIIPLAKRINTS